MVQVLRLLYKTQKEETTKVHDLLSLLRLKCPGADFWVLNIFPKNAQLSPLGIYNSRPWNSHKHVSSEIDQFWIFFLFGPLISLLILLLLTGRMTIVFLNFQFSISAGGCIGSVLWVGVIVFVYLQYLYLYIWRICICVLGEFTVFLNIRFLFPQVGAHGSVLRVGVEKSRGGHRHHRVHHARGRFCHHKHCQCNHHYHHHQYQDD